MCVYIYICIYIYICGTFSLVASCRTRPIDPETVCCTKQQAFSAVSHSRTCLRRETADMSDVSRNRHGGCATHQTCLLCDADDMSAVAYSNHVCCVAKQTANMSAVPRSRHVCWLTQQTCLPFDVPDMSAV